MADDRGEVLDYLREQFARVHVRFDRIEADIGDLKARMTTVELQLGGFMGTEQSHYGQIMQRIDRIETRLARIERRLDLADAPAGDAP